jgi:hypothetical protein
VVSKESTTPFKPEQSERRYGTFFFPRCGFHSYEAELIKRRLNWELIIVFGLLLLALAFRLAALGALAALVSEFTIVLEKAQAKPRNTKDSTGEAPEKDQESQS